MEATDGTSRAAVAFRRVSRSLEAKLFAVMLGVLLLSLGALGFALTRLQRRYLEADRVASATRISEVVRRSTTYSMLHNDRAALQQIVSAIGASSGVLGLRIKDAQGTVAFSSTANEIGRNVASGFSRSRVLNLKTPILNAPTCASAACHAHSPQQKVLGELDIDLSLASADASVRQTTQQFAALAVLVIALTLGTTSVLLGRLVGAPVRALRDGTERLRRGELGVQIPVESCDELGALAWSFNSMSRQVEDARNTLEQRVQAKTAELQIAQRQMIEAEKLTSLGKLAAVVAHEINNPLSGILCDAKLMRKWIERGDSLDAHTTDIRESLQLIESESRRCGELVRNLLTFARVPAMNITDVDLNHLVHQCIKLVSHKMALGNIDAHLQLDEMLPPVRGDAGQLEQLFLALIMNAIDAMPREGELRVNTRTSGLNAIVQIIDNGTGIDPSLFPRLFDPFVTTKEVGKGVGLGLAISRSIVDRHQGSIDVQSAPGKGTTFTITLPVIPSQPTAPRREDEPVSANSYC